MRDPVDHDQPEITEVVRIRAMEVVNGQPVDQRLVDLAREDEAVDTAVVSFFDVDYVRSAEDVNEHSDRARTRSIIRRSKARESFIP